MKPILYLMTLVLLTLSPQVRAAARADSGAEAVQAQHLAEAPPAAVAGQKLNRWQAFKQKARPRLERWRDRLIYPRGWFFICLGIAALLAGGAFALVSYAILSTILTVGAIAAGVVALFFLARWVGYYWRY